MGLTAFNLYSAPCLGALAVGGLELVADAVQAREGNLPPELLVGHHQVHVPLVGEVVERVVVRRRVAVRVAL
jgi:hypothetical protein